MSDIKLPAGANFTADMKSYSNYYPFGMEQPARTYQSGGYRYGYNGKEKDDEVKGGGNSYDYGARIYDSRLGRWLSLDPLQHKYADLSPYHYTANNPIKFVDTDGRDYKVHVNHKTKIITITAKYHALKGDGDNAIQQGVDRWNSENGKWEYKFQSEGKTVKYAVKFDLAVVRHETKKEQEAAYRRDNSGESNIFINSTPKDNPDHLGGTFIGAEIDKYGGWNYIMAKADAKNLLYDVHMHEIGHTLGLDHFVENEYTSGGIMRRGIHDGEYGFKYMYVSTGNVSKILYVAGVGILHIGRDANGNLTDAQFSTINDVSNNPTLQTTGTAPPGFNQGQVQRAVQQPQQSGQQQSGQQNSSTETKKD